jgi:hypothetical protein
MTNLVNTDFVRSMLQNTNYFTGIPFSASFGNQLWTCCLWRKSPNMDFDLHVAEFKATIELHSRNPEMYIPIQDFHIEQNGTATFFNLSLTDTSLQKFMETLYVPACGKLL